MSEKPKVWSVTQLNMALKDLIEDGFFPFWLSGEVGNLTVHRSGHVYFTLKDARSQVQAVFFSGAQTVRNLQIREGTEVEIYGRLTVYEARGNYQISVQKMSPKGLGVLMARFEELKAKLHAEGLFEPTRKKQIPLLPSRIAVVTSPEGAAIRDFLNVIQRRYSNIHIRIFPCAVQGQNAAGQIARQIRNCNALKAADVIIVTRGGGSLEDLWAFNEEEVARAVADSQIPLISAVGHEVDFSICDFVSDMRVPTPSAAAELVIGQKAHFQDQITNFSRRLRSSLQLKISHMRQRLDRLSNSVVLRDPLRPLQDKQQYLDDLQKRLEDALTRQLEQKKNKLDQLIIKCELLSPQRVLERGYAIVSRDQKVQMNADDIDEGAELQIRLAEGELTAVKIKGKDNE